MSLPGQLWFAMLSRVTSPPKSEESEAPETQQNEANPQMVLEEPTRIAAGEKAQLENVAELAKRSWKNKAEEQEQGRIGAEIRILSRFTNLLKSLTRQSFPVFAV